jgi:hypothetical protein
MIRITLYLSHGPTLKQEKYHSMHDFAYSARWRERESLNRGISKPILILMIIHT